MTTLELYRKHKSGKVSREKFLYEVRRDNNLPWITNLTSYDDAVKILKNKGIVTEASLRSLIAPLATKLESMGYDVDYGSGFGFMTFEAFKTLPDGSVLRMYLAPSDKELQQKNYGGSSEDFSTIDVSFTHWTTEVTKKFFGLYKQKKQVMNNLPDEEGNNIDLGTGMFDIPIEQSVDRVIELLKKAEAKVSNTSLNEGQTKEAKADEAVKAEVKPKKVTEKKSKELHIDQVNPYEYRHGIQHELCELDDYSDEALEKAKDKVLKNLAKDANYYSTLLNQKQSPYEFKQTETDAKGMQAKADGHLKKELKKDEKSNVKDTLGKKEAGKKKPKGVKVMPDKGVTGSEKTIKEGLEAKSYQDGDHTEIEIDADSGDYVGYVEADGTVTFAIEYADVDTITDENWKEELGPNHAFVQIYDAIGGDVSTEKNYVQITVNANQLLDRFENIKEEFKEDKLSKIKETLKKALKTELSSPDTEIKNTEIKLADLYQQRADSLKKQ